VNATLASTSTGETIAVAGDRISSIDIFRGLTMAVMIFVNALSDGVHGLPWGTYHAKAQQDLMTYVDMVFPFFLFAVGLSLPLSIAQRLRRHSSVAALWVHVVVRSASLVVLGLVLANADQADRARMGFSGSLWGLLCLLCAGLYLNVYGKSERARAWAWPLRILGLVGLAILLALFRRTTETGHAAWLDFSYPEILGLIGLSYLAAAILYIPTRRWRWAPLAWFAVLLAFNILSTARLVSVRLPIYVWPFDNGAMACIVMAGVVVSSIFLRPDRTLPVSRTISIGVLFGLLAFAGAYLLIPLGISKIRATPTWSLYSIAAATFLFILLYWVCDMRRRQGWAWLVRPAGGNTLTTYLLPDLWAFVCGAVALTWWDMHYKYGWPGVVKTLIFTFAILILARILTRAKIRLQL